MECPYCRSPIEKKIEFNLNSRHRVMFEEILASGQEGVDKKEFTAKYFRGGVSPITVRTTLNRLNERISPLRISTLFGRVRVV